MIRSLALVASLAMTTMGAPSFATFGPPSAAIGAQRASNSAVVPLASEHQYRIAGKIRLLFFWVGKDDVGSARLTRQGEAGQRTIALLIGADPRRAPREISEWGYVREEQHDDTIDVFGVRSLTDPDSLDEAEAKVAEGSGPQLFGALCSTVSATDIRSWTTTVRVQREVTYRQFGRLLDAVGASTHWTERRAPRPADAAPGFLIALDRLIHDSTSAARQGRGATPTQSSLVYVYKGGVYELRLRHAEPLTQARIGSTIFHDLIRGSFRIRNTATGSTTDFDLTYGVDGPVANLPVEASYQPHWWLKVELRLDEGTDVPAGPADASALLDRIRAICRAHRE